MALWRPLGLPWSVVSSNELGLEPCVLSLMELLPSSRVGLDWACSMAEILRSLNSAPLWRDVIATFTDHCIKQLPFQLKHTNIFTLLVLVGFPQVPHSEGLRAWSPRPVFTMHTKACVASGQRYLWKLFPLLVYTLLSQYCSIVKIMGWFMPPTFLTVKPFDSFISQWLALNNR